MSLGTIIIVDPLSSGTNFIADIIKRGYKPVGLWSKRSAVIFLAMKKSREEVESRYSGLCEFITQDEDYEKTRSLVKTYAPRFIIPGGEIGVELSARLCADLGLVCNPLKRLPVLTNKYLMNRALEQCSVRSIKSAMVHNLAEILAFFHENDNRACVLKPYRGAGSYGVRTCESEEELKAAYDEVFKTANVLGGDDEGMLIQERIDGVEYVVNTVSVKGRHKVTSILKYDRFTVKGGGRVYSIAESVNPFTTGCSSLIRYTFAVLKALGVENGNVHTELMVDEIGPVLIEVNCRVMGGDMQAEFLDTIFGHHDTDVLLDAYLHEEDFLAHINEPLQPRSHGLVKFLISPRDMEVVATPVLAFVKHLKSFNRISLNAMRGSLLKRTVDLRPVPAQSFLSMMITGYF